jgi:hypothetical protein
MASKDESQHIWKRRSSEIRGYERAMYSTLSNGDYLRVDYNLGEKTVRLYAEVIADHGASYYSVIKNGRITSEKNSRGKSSNVAEKLKERSDEFSTLPNKDVLELINKNYSISSNSISNILEKKSKKERLQVEREEIKRKYFRSEDMSSLGSVIYKSIGLKKVGFIDFLDITAGILISAVVFYLNQYNLLISGAVATIWGIILGILDIFIRERDPFFLKILFFLISGAGIYIYSYLYL